jgi:y4mF family transcriptional regulator
MTEELILLIKNKRRELKLTQKDLADRSGVGLRFIRELEQGKKSLRLDKVNQVLAMFGCRMVPAKDAYDLVNTRLVIPEKDDPEESTLSLNGKRSRLEVSDFVKFGINLC